MFDSVVPHERELKMICNMINSKLGMKFGEEKYPLITSRLGKRIRDLGLKSYQDYLELVKRDQDEETLFFNLLTTNVTYFFREPWQFEYLKEMILPSMVETIGDKTLRCWSAGCATGEEAYTLGMILLDVLPRDWTVKVLASDICTSSLNYAAQGIYYKEQTQNIPDVYLKKYFVPVSSDTVRVSDSLRKAVIFRRINLNDASVLPATLKVNFIFCRNVFIYFTKEARARVVNLFYEHLMPGGYLFLGHSEPIDCSNDPRWESLKGCIYRKRLDTSRLRAQRRG